MTAFHLGLSWHLFHDVRASPGSGPHLAITSLASIDLQVVLLGGVCFAAAAALVLIVLCIRLLPAFLFSTPQALMLLLALNSGTACSGKTAQQ
jgi:hypothetical protein